MPQSVFLFKTGLDICGLLWLNTSFRIFFCISVKDAIGILIGITMNLIDGETMKTVKDFIFMSSKITAETVRDFIFMGSKITADGDCSHEIKRHLLLGKKVMTNIDSVFKNRDITLPTKVHRVKSMVFPVVMYGCESWTIKKAEH